MGWIRLDTWPEIAERLPRPLTRGEALADLRWHAYEGGGLLSLEGFAVRWGWASKSGKPSKKRVRLLLASEEWKDVFIEQKGTARARQGHARGTVRAREGHGAEGESPDIPQEGAREGHDKGTRGAREGRGQGYTRANDSNPNPDPTRDPTREERAQGAPPPLPIPDWMKKWRRTNKPPRRFTNEDLLRLASHGITAVTGRDAPRPSPGYGRPVLNAWARFSFPEIGDPGVDPAHLPTSCALGIVALLADAAKRCPRPEFRSHIRGYNDDGTTWKETPLLSPPVVLRMDSKAGGAPIEARYEVALQWDADGRPTVPDDKPLRAKPRDPATMTMRERFERIERAQQEEGARTSLFSQ